MTRRDLAVLVADKDMEHALKGLLTRPHAMGVRSVAYDTFVHPQHDPACARRGVSFLSSLSAQYDHALLLFDHQGSGRETTPSGDLQREIDGHFAASTWGDRARAVVVDPELEAWVWSPSPHVDEVAGWAGRSPSLRQWLVSEGWLQERAPKPARPKAAFLAALQAARVARSSSLYQQLAEKVSLKRCQDRSFRRLLTTLREWFPVESLQ